MEIGSVYEIDPQSIADAGRDRNTPLQLKEVEKYGKKNIAYTASAREAISLALQSMEKENPDICKKCLMPGYMCDTVFIPFEQNEWELCFYHIGKDMKADERELRNLLEKEKPSLLFIHGYYGVDTWKELRPFLQECQKQGVQIMEDTTQAYYLETDYQADYIIGSLRKWYAVADGGFLVTDHLIAEDVLELDEYIAFGRLRMQIKKWNYLQAVAKGWEKLNDLQRSLLQKDKEEYLALNRLMENYLDQTSKVAEISVFSRNMLMQIDEEACKNRRNANCRILQEGLQNKKTLTPVMGEDCLDAAPLYFPVYMENRDDLQEYLRQRDIYVPVLWPIGKENADCLSEDEKYIYSHLAAIPMDQRYGEEEMKRIVDVVEEYERSIL